ncbi:TlpA disulfide reductase family protein [Aquimarina gracilis]|uniref:TlpA disulfide reductase family protein n=1 Tax=Aquimarina gracilis TaxID=874422 RepID=A0ABU5ZQB9_9FLAO|nr:TlpA disulfide reductase family protein [Aquimarina gracilis]MEB3344271.1 TlpA disulfide reductase family protein [Aquimarina gracilis]
MKIFVGLLLLFGTISCTQKNTKDLDYVINKFNENANQIRNVEYKIHRIDTFPRAGLVWDNSGYAYAEKQVEDTIFGISFYAKRFDINKEYIYKNSIGYEFDEEKKEFKNEKGAIGFLGKPGGQMISLNIFKLDSMYSNIELSTNPSYYVLKYEFEDDTIYNVTQVTKTLYLRKKDFFPVKIIRRSKVLDNSSASYLTFSNIKVNTGNNHKIDSLIENKIVTYSRINEKTKKRNRIIGKPISTISLPNLENDTLVHLEVNKPILLDFWETWCGPCIASLPKIEELAIKYSNDIQIIGIVSEDRENARKLIKKKNITFLNVLGNNNLLKQYNINSFPRYILIDNSGIIQKEYFSFSKQIEKDINKLTSIE